VRLVATLHQSENGQNVWICATREEVDVLLCALRQAGDMWSDTIRNLEEVQEALEVELEPSDQELLNWAREHSDIAERLLKELVCRF